MVTFFFFLGTSRVLHYLLHMPIMEFEHIANKSFLTFFFTFSLMITEPTQNIWIYDYFFKNIHLQKV